MKAKVIRRKKETCWICHRKVYDLDELYLSITYSDEDFSELCVGFCKNCGRKMWHKGISMKQLSRAADYPMLSL